MKLIPGQVAHTDIDIVNKGDKPLTLDAYFNDYTISSASDVRFKPPATLPGSAAPWSSLDQDVLKVPANARFRVTLTIHVPKDAALGTHALAVIFRSRDISTKPGSNVKYRPAVASLLAAGVANPDGSGLVMKGAAKIASVDVSWLSLSDVIDLSDKLGAIGDWLFRPTVTAHVEVQNQGNTFFNILHGGTTFATTLDCPAGDDQGADLHDPPDSTRTIDASWTPGPVVASGTADVKLYYRHQRADGTAGEVRLVPWHLILTVVTVLLLLVGARMLRRQRRRRKVSAPVESPWIRRRPAHDMNGHLLEAVPNFSEGRDASVLDAIGSAMGDAGGRVLDIHADGDHNRSVFTVAGGPDELVEALAAGIAVAAARIDLTDHQGVHPRVGAADVVPIVRFADGDERPERAARALARRIAMIGSAGARLRRAR